MADKQKTLSIVIPVYFNESSLPLLFDEMRALESELGKRNMALELIFVDDGSGDGSYAKLLAFRAQRPGTKVIKHTRNFGANQACKSGFRYVTGDCFMSFAADLQEPPGQILEAADRWLGGAKYVISVRATRDDPFVTRLFARLFHRIVRGLVIADYPKEGFDLALMDRCMLPLILQNFRNFHLGVFSYWLGYQPTILHYHRRKRRFGKSRWTFLKKFNHFIDTVTGFSVTPIRVMSLLGVLVALVSFLYGCWIAIGALAGWMDVRGFATIVVLISFIGGMIMVMLGVIGEYVWRIFDSVTQKPEAVIEEALL